MDIAGKLAKQLRYSSKVAVVKTETEKCLDLPTEKGVYQTMNAFERFMKNNNRLKSNSTVD